MLAATTVTDEWVLLTGDVADDDATNCFQVGGLNDSVSGEFWYIDNFSCREVLADT